MMVRYSPYIPDVVPPEDREAITERLHAGEPRQIGFGKNPALIVVDMNNACVLDEFPSGHSKVAVPAARKIEKLIRACRAVGIPVIYTTVISFLSADHDAVKGRWKDKMPTIPKSQRELGRAIFDGVKPMDGDIVVEKDKASAFFGTQLASILTFLGTDTVIVSGVSTSGCVRATVCDAFQYNYRVIVPEECVFDRFSDIAQDQPVRHGRKVRRCCKAR